MGSPFVDGAVGLKAKVLCHTVPHDKVRIFKDAYVRKAAYQKSANEATVKIFS